jgi:hypothetical protein
VWRGQRQGNRKAKRRVRSVLRQAAARMKVGDELTERQEDERTGGCVWVMRQVTVEMRSQNEPTEMKEDERSRVSVWVMRQVTVRMRGQDR